MPVENELKYVVTPYRSWAAMTDSGILSVLVRQAYLRDGARVRRVEEDGADPRHFFAWKAEVSPGRNIEIEPTIPEADFQGLLSLSTRRLLKRRFSFHDTEVHWDVDFFLGEDGERLPFAMAEVEMPDGMDEPGRVHPLVASHVVHKVARGDKRYSSFALCDRAHLLSLARVHGLMALH